MLPGLLLGALLAATTPAPTITLRGQPVILPPVRAPAGHVAKVGLLVSASEEVLRKTLEHRGWKVEPAKDGPQLGTELPALHLERSGSEAWIWKRPQQVLNLSLWAVAVGGARPDSDGLAQDLEAGLAEQRKVTSPGLSWIELMAAPEDGSESVSSPDLGNLLVPPVISEVETTEKKVALTFDACSTLDPSRYDQRVVDILVREKVPATLFIGGRWAEEHPDILKNLAANPLFEIGNHTYSHPHMADVPPERMRDELARTQKAIVAVTGHAPTLWRPPYGEYSLRTVAEASHQGLTTIEYDLASGDPDPKLTPEKIAEWVQFKAHPGSIVVMHMNGHGKHTFEALPLVIKGLRAKGYSFVTVSDLIHPTKAVAGVQQP